MELLHLSIYLLPTMHQEVVLDSKNRIVRTLEDKLSIASEVINNKRNYSEVAISYNMSYHTVYKYVRIAKKVVKCNYGDGRPRSFDEKSLILLREFINNFPDSTDWEIREEVRKLYKEMREREDETGAGIIFRPLSQRSVKRYTEIAKILRQNQ